MTSELHVLQPRRPLEATADDSLPADLTVQVGSGTAAIVGSLPLREFVARTGTLTHAQRVLIVEQALVLLDDNYVHLPLKSAMHAVDPVQRLRLLRARLGRQTDATMGPERAFHAELSSIFHSVRDLHTNYLLPAPFAGQVAYLPFQVERCVEGPTVQYVVTRIAAGVSAPMFRVGVRVLHWNGVPIERAVAVNADRFAGSNLAARLSRGVQSLTIRPLRLHLPPDEEWVTVTYLDHDGVLRELREPWLVGPNVPPMADADAITTAAASMGLDLLTDEVSRATALLYAPQAVEQQLGRTDVALTTVRAAPGADVPTSMPLVFRARSVVTAAGTFGHLRVFTFNVPDPDAFVVEFVRLVELMPQDGLVLDVRGNGGGHILASEFALQTLTPRRITPEPVQFICTPLNLAIARQHAGNPTGEIDLGPWLPSMEQAVETGSVFSAAFPITPEDGANAIGQCYFGPVVLVTDARCYSATDIFAAGFQDHGIGPVLGVDDNTGAGGANVWTHGLLKLLLEVPQHNPESPYVDLPRQADMRVSIRRTLRVGALAGTPVEDLGITPDHRHEMTRRDVLEGNVDLMERAGQLLAGMPRRRLEVALSLSGGRLTVEVDVTGVDRLDVYVDGRPRASTDTADGHRTITVDGVPDARVVRVEGLADGALVAARSRAVSEGTGDAESRSTTRLEMRFREEPDPATLDDVVTTFTGVQDMLVVNHHAGSGGVAAPPDLRPRLAQAVRVRRISYNSPLQMTLEWFTDASGLIESLEAVVTLMTGWLTYKTAKLQMGKVDRETEREEARRYLEEKLPGPGAAGPRPSDAELGRAAQALVGVESVAITRS